MATYPARVLAAKLTPEEMIELKRLAAHERAGRDRAVADGEFAELAKLRLAEEDGRGCYCLSEFGRLVLAHLPP